MRKFMRRDLCDREENDDIQLEHSYIIQDKDK